MNGEPMISRVLKFSYDRLVSQTKLDILKALQKGGKVESLEELKELTGYGKPLLSYYIQGVENSQRLVDLGLVEVRRAIGGRALFRR